LWYDEAARNGRFHFRSGRRNGRARQKVFYVDDYFPCKPDGKPAYSKTKEGELWVALIEKAFAKCYRSYEELYGGQSAEALFQMTGYKCETVDWTTKSNGNHYPPRLTEDQIWSKLLSFDKKKYVMTCSGVDSSSKRMNGLVVGDHVYTLLGVHDLGTVKLVELRNPWGRREWCKDWSDRSKMWNTIPKEDKDRLLTKANDGKFFMSLKDFHQYFGTVTVCYYDYRDLPNGWKECIAKNGYIFYVSPSGVSQWERPSTVAKRNATVSTHRSEDLKPLLKRRPRNRRAE